MNFKKCAEEDLENYRRRLEAIQSIRERIEVLRAGMDVKAVRTDKVAVLGGASKAEKNLVNSLYEIEKLKMSLKTTTQLCNIIKKGLDSLSDEEQTVLKIMYVEPINHPIDELCEMLNISKPQVYRIRDKALYKFTITCYGLPEI